MHEAMNTDWYPCSFSIFLTVVEFADSVRAGRELGELPGEIGVPDVGRVLVYAGTAVVLGNDAADTKPEIYSPTLLQIHFLLDTLDIREYKNGQNSRFSLYSIMLTRKRNSLRICRSYLRIRLPSCRSRCGTSSRLWRIVSRNKPTNLSKVGTRWKDTRTHFSDFALYLSREICHVQSIFGVFSNSYSKNPSLTLQATWLLQ